ERLGALPPDAVIGIDTDNAARDRFVWTHRHLLAPTAELTAVRDELQERKARSNPLYVSLDDEADKADQKADQKAPAPPIGDRLRALQHQLGDARVGPEPPKPRVSTDGTLQILLVRTRFASGEVSRNAGTLAAVGAAVEE